jgi:hypothetical protein
MVMDPLMIRCGVPAQEKRGNASIGVPPFLSHRQPARCVYQSWSATGGAVRTTLTPPVVAHGYGMRLMMIVEGNYVRDEGGKSTTWRRPS